MVWVIVKHMDNFTFGIFHASNLPVFRSGSVLLNMQYIIVLKYRSCCCDVDY
jgi:hypothetical protein